MTVNLSSFSPKVIAAAREAVVVTNREYRLKVLHDEVCKRKIRPLFSEAVRALEKLLEEQASINGHQQVTEDRRRERAAYAKRPIGPAGLAGIGPKFEMGRPWIS